MVNTYSLSCSSDTDAGLGLATADKQRAGLVGNQIAPRLPLTDYREEAPVGVDTAVPVASGNALEGAAAQMQDSSPQVQCLLSCCFVPCLRQILCFLCMLRVCFQSSLVSPCASTNVAWTSLLLPSRACVLWLLCACLLQSQSVTLHFANRAISCIAICVYYHCTATELCVMMCRSSEALLAPQKASGKTL